MTKKKRKQGMLIVTYDVKSVCLEDGYGKNIEEKEHTEKCMEGT